MGGRREDGREEEREAVDRMKAGDPGGLELLVRRHQGRAVRTAHLIVGERALAEDVVQDAFVRAYERIGTFDAGRPFGPWFMRLVVNGSVDAASGGRRRASREAPLKAADAGGAAGPADPGPDPHELAERADLRERVLAALDGLPPAQRAAIVQRYYLGMSESEMAEGGSSPLGTIKWRLHSARKKLAGILRPPSRAAEAPAGPVGTAAPTVAHQADIDKEDRDGRA